jgi:hypothetical protein
MGDHFVPLRPAVSITKATGMGDASRTTGNLQVAERQIQHIEERTKGRCTLERQRIWCTTYMWWSKALENTSECAFTTRPLTSWIPRCVRGRSWQHELARDSLLSIVKLSKSPVALFWCQCKYTPSVDIPDAIQPRISRLCNTLIFVARNAYRARSALGV